MICGMRASYPATRLRSRLTFNGAMNRGPATLATVIALALINLGLATSIVGVMGTATWAPPWLGLLVVVAGIGAAIAAVLLWRQYLSGVRER